MDFVSQISGALASGSLITLPLSLVAGVIAGLNPCCLALYPVAAATCCVGRDCGSRRSAPIAFAFVLGIAVSMAGRITGVGQLGRHLVAVVPLLIGLHLLGWIRIPLDRLILAPLRAGGAFGTGFLLSFVIGPCGAPVLALVLSYVVYQGQLLYGALLLFLFGLGTGIPLLLVGTTAGNLVQRLDGIGWKVWVDRLAGGWLLALGFYLLWIA